MKLRNLLLLSLLTLLLNACSRQLSPEAIEESLRQAEIALAEGDMVAARSVLSNLSIDSSANCNMTAAQLARLSMVYMQLADSADQELNTNQAADLYDMAYKSNAHSADSFYRNVDPEHLQYVETLSNHSANRSNPVDISNLPDEMDSLDYHHMNDSI